MLRPSLCTSEGRGMTMGSINRRNEMSLQGILVVHIFYVWRIDFIGPFPPSFGNLYILLVVDYVSKGRIYSLSQK